MKKIFLFVVIAATALFLFSVSGCRKTREREQEQEEEKKEEPENPSDKDKQKIGDLEFSFELKSENGERTVADVIKTPKASLSIECNDDGTNFVLEYSINGGEKKIIKKLWPGKDYSFDNALLTAQEYGRYKISGILYEEEHPDAPLSVEKEMWMLYKQAEVKTVSVLSISRTEAINDSLTLYEDEEGEFVIEYTPANTYLPISVISSNSSVVSLNASSASNTSGTFKIPFLANKKGTADITLTFTNGPSEETRNFRVDVVEDTDGKSFSLTTSCDEFSIPGYNIQVDVSAAGGKKDQKFNLEFFIDGALVASSHNITIDKVTGQLFPVDGLSVGEHSLKVKLSSSEKPEYYKEELFEFSVATPRLLIKHDTDSKLLDNGASTDVSVAKTYSITADGVTAKYKDRISIFSTVSSDSMSGSWPWSYIANSYGKGDIKMQIRLDRSQMAEMVFHILRKDTCEMLLEYVHETTLKDRERTSECAVYLTTLTDRYKHSVFGVWSSVTYYGSCVYLVGNNIVKDDTPENETRIATTEKSTRYFQPMNKSYETKTAIADLLSVAFAIEEEVINSEYWYTTPSGEVWPDLMYGSFYYSFVLSNITLRLNLNGKDSEGLYFKVHLKTISPYQVSAGNSNISFVQN